MDAFYVLGSVLAGWALILAALGIVSDSFPSSANVERLVAGVTVLLVAGAIGGAIYQASQEPPRGEDGAAGKSAAALVP